MVPEYPYPHHGGNRKFQRGGGGEFKGPGNSGEKGGGLSVKLCFQMVQSGVEQYLL